MPDELLMGGKTNKYGLGVAKVTLAGISLDARAVSWSLVAGVTPFVSEIVVSTEAGNSFLSMSARKRKNVALRFEISYEENGKNKKTDITFKGIRIVELVSAPNPYQQRWRLTDRRYELENRLMSRRFNIRRKANSGRVDPKTKGRTAVDYELIQDYRYIPDTLRVDKPEGAEFPKAITNRGEQEITTPWTALKIAEHVLIEMGLPYRIEMEDNNYIKEELDFRMESPASLLSTALMFARGDIYQDADGNIVVYSLDITSKEVTTVGTGLVPLLGTTVNAGDWPIIQDLKCSAPEKFRFYFEKEYELRFDYKETSPERTNFSLNLDNVIPLPENLQLIGPDPENPDSGNTAVVGTLVRGTYVPIKEVIQLWKDEANNTTGISLPKFVETHMNIENLRKRYFAGWESYFMISDTSVNPIWHRRATVLKQHYRRTFRILPRWMDRILKWDTIRCTITDPTTHRRQPSPVFMNYFVRPTLHGLRETKEGSSSRAFCNISGYADATDDAKSAPFNISVVDQELGIFSITPYSDLHGIDSEIIAGQVVSESMPSLRASAERKLLQDAQLDPGFNFATILSVILAEPQDNSRYHMVEFDVGKGRDFQRADNGIIQDVFVTQDTARYRWNDGIHIRLVSDPENEDSKPRLTVENAKMESYNEEAVRLLAMAEVDRKQYNWQERLSGAFSAIGFDKKLFRPIGPVRSVTFTFSGSGDLPRTYFNLIDALAPRPVWEFLPQDIKNVIYKLIDQDNLG